MALACACICIINAMDAMAGARGAVAAPCSPLPPYDALPPYGADDIGGAADTLDLMISAYDGPPPPWCIGGPLLDVGSDMLGRGIECDGGGIVAGRGAVNRGMPPP